MPQSPPAVTIMTVHAQLILLLHMSVLVLANVEQCSDHSSRWSAPSHVFPSLRPTVDCKAAAAIVPTTNERLQRQLHNSTMDAAITMLAQCGVVAIQGLVQKTLLRRISAEVFSRLDNCSLDPLCGHNAQGQRSPVLPAAKLTPSYCRACRTPCTATSWPDSASAPAVAFSGD